MPAAIWSHSHPELSLRAPKVFSEKAGSPFGIAGLWENWKDPASGEWIRTFAVITTDGNDLVPRSELCPRKTLRADLLKLDALLKPLDEATLVGNRQIQRRSETIPNRPHSD